MGPQSAAPKQPVYIFLDESGNFDFSPSGSKYFTMTAVSFCRPFPIDEALTQLRFDLIESGTHLEYFHASEDRQLVRDRVFATIQTAIQSFRADSIIVEKCKTAPAVRQDHRFYPEMLAYLVRYVANGLDSSKWSEFIVITDRIPVNKKREAVEKAVKKTLAAMLPKNVRYRILHHDSKSCCGLQIADYFGWALFRAWEKDDRRSLEVVKSAFRSQFEIFRHGTTKWYSK